MDILLKALGISAAVLWGGGIIAMVLTALTGGRIFGVKRNDVVLNIPLPRENVEQWAKIVQGSKN